MGRHYFRIWCKMTSLVNIILKRIKYLFRYRSYFPTEYYLIHEKNLIYIPIPKVACTSIKLGISNTEEVDYSKYMTIHSQTSQYCTYRPYKNLYKYKCFTFVRNPFSRIVSCYNDKVIKPIQHNKKYYFDSLYNKFIIRLIGNKSLYPKISFEEFVEIVTKIPDFISDGHFRSQTSIIFNSISPKIDYIGKFESIDDDWFRLASIYNLGSISKHNKSNSDDWENFFTNKEILLKVGKRYMNDIIIFGYIDSFKKLLRKFD